MDTAAVMAWVGHYEAGWRAADPGVVARLFSPDVVYRRSPYERAEIGHDAIADFWAEDEGETFTVDASPVAVQDDRAVVRLVVRYGDPLRQEYTDLWLLRFAGDGRVAEFEEWPYWPGRAYTAEGGG